MRHWIVFGSAALAAVILILAARGAAAGQDTAQTNAEEDGLFGLSYRQSDQPRSMNGREPLSSWDGQMARPTAAWNGRQPQTEVTEDYWVQPRQPAETVPQPPRLNAAQNELVRQIQTSLQALGYDPGPADGLHGERTLKAIRAYQADRGLPVTGVFSPDLMQRISEEVAGRRAVVEELAAAPALRAAAIDRGRPIEKVVRPRDIDPIPAERDDQRNPTVSPEAETIEPQVPANAIEDTASMPPTLAQARQAQPLHLAALDLAAVGIRGEDLPRDLLEALLISRWHYESAVEEPIPERFFTRGDRKPDAAVLAGMIPSFVQWSATHAPRPPFALIAPTPLHPKSSVEGAYTTSGRTACFDPEPHLMARAHIDTAAEFCRSTLTEAIGKTEPAEVPAARLAACQRLIELSDLRVFHQLTGDESCGGTGYKEPRFVLDRAYIFKLTIVSDGGKPEDTKDLAAYSPQYLRVTGIRYAAETPSMYFTMHDVISETGFDRIVGRVPDSMNPARHYLIYEVEPFDPEIAAAQQAEASVE